MATIGNFNRVGGSSIGKLGMLTVNAQATLEPVPGKKRETSPDFRRQLQAREKWTHVVAQRAARSAEACGKFSVNVPLAETGGFYVVADVGRVPTEGCLCPRSRITFAAAVTLTICVNVLRPASKIDLFNPALAAAPLGRYFPFPSCLGAGAFVRFFTCKSSKKALDTD